MSQLITNPGVLIPLLLIAVAWIVSRHKAPAKLPGLTAERRRAITAHHRFRARFALRKASDGASTPASYGTLTSEQQQRYRETRERMDDLRRAA